MGYILGPSGSELVERRADHDHTSVRTNPREHEQEDAQEIRRRLRRHRDVMHPCRTRPPITTAAASPVPRLRYTPGSKPASAPSSASDCAAALTSVPYRISASGKAACNSRPKAKPPQPLIVGARSTRSSCGMPNVQAPTAARSAAAPTSPRRSLQTSIACVEGGSGRGLGIDPHRHRAQAPAGDISDSRGYLAATEIHAEHDR